MASGIGGMEDYPAKKPASESCGKEGKGFFYGRISWAYQPIIINGLNRLPRGTGGNHIDDL